MNPSDLARSIATQRAASLAKLQPAKREARARAESMWNERQDLTTTLRTESEARAIVGAHDFDLFPTPADLAAEMVERADLRAGDIVLEPSAGTGRIAAAIREAGFEPVCVEFAQSPAEYLRKQGYNVTQCDFMDYDQPADAIVMNPPFSKGQDIDHVRHAFDLLRPGGRLVAIMSEGGFFRTDRKARDFRDWLERVGGSSEKLDPDTFKVSGTTVQTRLVYIEKE